MMGDSFEYFWLILNALGAVSLPLVFVSFWNAQNSRYLVCILLGLWIIVISNFISGSVLLFVSSGSWMISMNDKYWGFYQTISSVSSYTEITGYILSVAASVLFISHSHLTTNHKFPEK